MDEFLNDEVSNINIRSQQNGLAKRKKRTLLEPARTMMVECKSLYNFWAKKINTTCHETNRLCLSKILRKTPSEILTRNKRSLNIFLFLALIACLVPNHIYQAKVSQFGTCLLFTHFSIATLYYPCGSYVIE
jgi:hypothetical protein